MAEVPVPPAVPALAERPAVIEPPLRELVTFSGPDTDDVREVDVDRVDDREGDSMRAQAREVAFADDRVRQLLGDRKHTVIGVSRLDSKRSKTPASLLVAFCHDDGLAYEVTLESDGDRLAVRDVVAADYQPAPSDAEVEAAIVLASGHRLVADLLEPDFEAHALLTSSVEPGDEHYGRRRFSVVFGPPQERLPRVHAVVDTGSETVLWVHANQGGRR